MHKKNVNSAAVVYLVKVPDDYQSCMDTYSTELTKTIGQLNGNLLKTFTRAERSLLLNELGYLCSFRSVRTHKRKDSNRQNYCKIQQHIVALILDDGSTLASDMSCEVQEMIYFAAEKEDHDIVLDMRQFGNCGASELFQPFFNATKQVLENEGFVAVCERRHDDRPHLAAVTGGARGAGTNFNGNGYAPPFISISNLKERVIASGLLPEDCCIPSDSTLALAFWPSNPTHKVAQKYTGKLGLKYCAQSRQL